MPTPERDYVLAGIKTKFTRKMERGAWIDYECPCGYEDGLVMSQDNLNTDLIGLHALEQRMMFHYDHCKEARNA